MRKEKGETHLCPPLGCAKARCRERKLLALLERDLVGRLRRVVVQRDDCERASIVHQHPLARRLDIAGVTWSRRARTHLFLPLVPQLLRIRTLLQLLLLLPHRSRRSSPAQDQPYRPAAPGP